MRARPEDASGSRRNAAQHVALRASTPNMNKRQVWRERQCILQTVPARRPDGAAWLRGWAGVECRGREWVCEGCRAERMEAAGCRVGPPCLSWVLYDRLDDAVPGERRSCRRTRRVGTGGARIRCHMLSIAMLGSESHASREHESLTAQVESKSRACSIESVSVSPASTGELGSGHRYASPPPQGGHRGLVECCGGVLSYLQQNE